MGGLWKLGTFRPLGNWVFDKERQNEIYLEAAIRTERCNAAVWHRRVGERGRWHPVPEQGRLGIAACQIRLASFWIGAGPGRGRCLHHQDRSGYSNFTLSDAEFALSAR